MSLVVHQVARPAGRATAEQFTIVEEPMPVPGPGEALVENLYLSVDPYMRELMDFQELHIPFGGRAIGQVLESNDPGLAVGDLVFHVQGWRTHAVVSMPAARVLPRLEGVAASAFLSVLGGTGLSAYVGLKEIARVQPGDSVFISAAAGGVGSAAGQIARLLGATRVVGSAGSAGKVRHLIDDLGFDAAFNYRDGDLSGQLAAAAPAGIDVYFDNVGGEHLAAAIGALRPHGRIAWCGAVAQYDIAAEPPAAPYNLFEIVDKSLRLEGFLVRNYRHLQPELEEFLIPHLRTGRFLVDETIVVGFENVVDAFLSMLAGANTGKMLLRVHQTG
ncbi:NADP-dependent oxidoreductase [Plantactinospora soyae]|uniref:NADPH-dependent curcumin reductase CurA n=1 Tax=Plantactinospora soyae TaxID=1544732 RepID=A0A927QZX3_9ACTN|nr:NADP-dependent oxidoreductase [Plantactinospora soyae]MBE1490905.1 NADPH-dependent curcumin reductase CurA [Plantactinospora soyae]